MGLVPAHPLRVGAEGHADVAPSGCRSRYAHGVRARQAVRRTPAGGVLQEALRRGVAAPLPGRAAQLPRPRYPEVGPLRLPQAAEARLRSAQPVPDVAGHQPRPHPPAPRRAHRRPSPRRAVRELPGRPQVPARGRRAHRGRPPAEQASVARARTSHPNSCASAMWLRRLQEQRPGYAQVPRLQVATGVSAC